MAKRSFLIPFAAAIAALTGTAQAAVDRIQTSPVDRNAIDATVPNTVVQPNTQKEGELLLPIGDDIFKYVLKRSETGVMVADHYSHSSHASHASHHSHYSSR